jgi:hypothetical protein
MVGKYIALWARNVPRSFTSVFTWIAGVASIASFTGVQLGALPSYAPWIVVVPAVVWILWQARPNVYLNPAHYINQALTLSELDKMLAPIPRVVLLGNSSVGKSTFMSRATHSLYIPRETAAPVATIVAVPDTKPPKYIALIDTVGRKYPSAANIALRADAAVLFLDNNDGNNDSALKQNRIKSHRDIARSNVGPALEESETCRFVAVVANKSDLWAADEKCSAKMSQLSEEIRDSISSATSGHPVEIIYNHSNNNPEDVSSLIRKLGDRL